MAENEQSTAALDDAAAEAVASQNNNTEETVEQVQEAVEQVEREREETKAEIAEAEQSAEELDAEGFPKEHKTRSDLGRKLSALHRRLDEQDNKFDRMMSYLESQSKPDEGQVDPDEPLTVADYKRLREKEDREKAAKQEKYNDGYKSAISRLGGDLTDSEWEGVIEEMKSLQYNPSDNPELDAERNFYRAERIYLRKLMAQPVEKKVPGKKEINKNLGVANSQKTVVKETKQPKLDGYSQSYYDYMVRSDGEESARKKVEGIG